VPEGPSSEEVIKTLRRYGFELVHQRGSHAKYRQPHPGGRTVIVPMGRAHLKIGTFRSICRQAGLQPTDF
jgi:predicted RNA binding protein YcfA (HicA-like mRNA interferase family)